jgi:hypothetical protein
MYTQADNTVSKSSLFTSVYGFMRVAVAQPGLLYISENRMSDSQGSDAPRRTVETNRMFLDHLFYFIFSAVAESYEGVIPNSYRDRFLNTSHTLPPPSPLSLTQQFLQATSASSRWLRGTLSLAWKIAFRLCGSFMVTNAASFRLPSLPGVFKRHENR